MDIASRVGLPTIAVALLVTIAGRAWAAPVDPMIQRRTAVVDVFEKCKDAVVNISSTQIIEYRGGGGLDSLFEQLFDLPTQRRVQRYKRNSVGSGFVLHRNGYIITNAHVVARTAERKVIFADGREYDADVIAIDTSRDLAVLKIETDRPLPVVTLGHSDDLMVGETVIAIGNPLGYQTTVTAGVVSALKRSLEVSEDVTFEDLIQTDASINPGNSGGPLLNVLGELVGINTAIRADAQNIGFAIPVGQLRSSLPDLLDIERRYRINVGLRVSGEQRCRVVAVEIDSPAHRAGVQVGDYITAIDNEPITTAIDYHIELINHKPGDVVRVQLTRDTAAVRADVTLTERPRPDGAKLLMSRLGIEAEPITPEMAERAGVPRLRGLVVVNVSAGSPAEAVGIRRGDVLDHLGRHQLTSMETAGELLEQVRPGQKVSASVLRFRGRTILRSTVTMQAQ